MKKKQVIKFQDKVWNKQVLKVNKIEVCKVCGAILTKKVQEPDRVVIVVKVICKDCKEPIAVEIKYKE